jgi:hypothetical protein
VLFSLTQRLQMSVRQPTSDETVSKCVVPKLTPTMLGCGQTSVSAESAAPNSTFVTGKEYTFTPADATASIKTFDATVTQVVPTDKQLILQLHHLTEAGAVYITAFSSLSDTELRAKIGNHMYTSKPVASVG